MKKKGVTEMLSDASGLTGACGKENKRGLVNALSVAAELGEKRKGWASLYTLICD